ncbi:glutathione S-transferase family protein [Pseudooceanicola sp.]|uniref:glutathione S-transferase family protein n=1 Tax=Pseudooceanicola sp. TaxID=1914328 RepID=UPI00262D759F|nr:glutathione S-transferase family protein [Pseudooceanicola sp.]MDF1855711.1 glutathione S-transferase family protein [Pseudooceanicola sp.]
MYEVIGGLQSRTFRVIWMLEELGQPYEHHSERPHSAKVLEHSTLGKIPVLLADGEALTDSVAIMTYLADKHGQFTAPAGSIARARQDGMTHQILDELEAPLWTAARHSFILPEDQRVPAVKASLSGEFGRNLDRLAARFQGPYLMGDEVTVPDFLAVHCLNWARGAKFPEVNGTLAAYAKRMRDRPAFQKVTEMVKG